MNRSGIKKIIYFSFFILFLFPSVSYSADINLSLSHRSIDNNVTIEVENQSPAGVQIETVSIELDNKKYEYKFQDNIRPQQKRSFVFKVKYPSLPGSYSLIATVRYYNDGAILSLKHVALFYYIEPAELKMECSAEDSAIEDEGEIVARAGKPELLKLVLPDEIEVISVSTFPGKRIFRVKSNLKGFRNRYTFFAIAEEVVDGRHNASICNGKLETGVPDKISGERGSLPSFSLLFQAIIFLGASLYLLFLSKNRSALFSALAKYTCRMFYLTFFYYFLKNTGVWLDFFLQFISWSTAQNIVVAARDNFLGSNYEYFFKYFVDWYWGACLLLTFPYLYYFDSDSPIEQDKYYCSLRTVFSLFNLFRGRKPYWNYFSRLGILTICVKLFYIPYLTSWAINNTFHQKNLLADFRWDIYTVNAFLVALFIYIDTVIYSFGYAVELKRLKNKIKSVEPTLLGWIVCLWCYPPFNIFSFRVFDYQLVNIRLEYPAWVNAAMTCFISALWGIFAWASLALGFKASNLTNRGIVSSGPYRYVRHPAYIAKLIIWIIQGVFFAQFSTGIMLGFVLIYYLRAWTEERHLSMDPDYIEYKKKVPYKFIPGVL
jgi:protein-S-isoprenylcysteine O-methyltransferase Ste14